MNHELDIKLIELVEKLPHLCNKNNAQYKERRAVENAWTVISSEMKCDGE